MALGVVACGATARPEGRREGALKAPRAVVASVGLHPAERFSRRWGLDATRHEHGDGIAAYARGVAAAQAAGRAGDPPPRRAPILFVPPLTGTRLEVRHQRRQGSILCGRNENWKQAWLPSRTQSTLLFDCWSEDLSLAWNQSNASYSPALGGVNVRVNETYSATMSIAAGVPIYAAYSNALETLGWKVGVDLFSIPYDWRQGPDAYKRPGGPFDRMKAVIEGAGEPVVALSLSMGGPFFALFCSLQSDEWLKQHIRSFVSLSGVFSGTANALMDLASGNFDGAVPTIFQKGFRNLLRSMGCLPWLLPRFDAQPRKTFLRTPTRNYTSADFGDLLHSVGADTAAAQWSLFADLGGLAIAPRVDTVCVTGYGVPTADSLTFPSDDIETAGYTVEYTDGDGTVPAESLAVCEDWARVMPQQVTPLRLFNATHAGVLARPEAFQALLDAAYYRNL